MMLEHLGEIEAGKAIVSAIERVMERGDASVITPDLKGRGTTETLGQAIAEALAAGDAQTQPAIEEEQA
jgi:tartrate dehydrogenase/decarboxylase/D-malate dehydrogenase